MSKIEETISSVVSKADELNKEYALTSAVKDLFAKAGTLSIEAIDATLKFAEENDVKGKVTSKFEELVASAKTSSL